MADGVENDLDARRLVDELLLLLLGRGNLLCGDWCCRRVGHESFEEMKAGWNEMN